MEEVDHTQRTVSGAVDRDHHQSAGDGRKTDPAAGNAGCDAGRVVTNARVSRAFCAFHDQRLYPAEAGAYLTEKFAAILPAAQRSTTHAFSKRLRF